MFCGEKLPRKMDMTKMEKIQLAGILEELNWLKSMHARMKTHGMASTGDFGTDERIRKEIGDWGDLARATVEACKDGKYTVRLDDSGNKYTIHAPHRKCEIGQRVTVRFLGDKRICM